MLIAENLRMVKSLVIILEMIKKVKTDIVFTCLPNKFAIDATFLALKMAHTFFVKNLLPVILRK